MNDIYMDLFNKNQDFRDYVEKYILKHHITFETALDHVLVRNYGDYILSKGARNENHLPTETIVNCGC